MPNTNINRKVILSSSYVFIGESLLFFSFCNPQPSLAQKILYDKFLFRPFKTVGYLTQMDRLIIAAAEFEQNATISLVNPSSTPVTLVNTPLFTKYEGWTGNSSTSYGDLNFNPGTGTNKYIRDDASAGIYIRNNTSGSMNDMGAITTPGLSVNARNATDNFNMTVNSATNSTKSTIGSSAGYSSGERVGSNSQQVYKNGVGNGVNVVASSAIPSLNIYIMCRNGSGVAMNFSNRQISGAYLGSSQMSQSVISSILNGYMTALGKNVY